AEKGVLREKSMQQLIENLADIPLLFQPGERWVYSVSVDVQAYLIEKWSGQKVGDFLQERLFDPLGMDQTMAWAPPDKANLLASVYTHADGVRTVDTSPTSTNHFTKPAYFSGGGQLISTADDYWRFAQMLLNGGEFDGQRYLSPVLVDMMSEDRLPDDMAISFYRGSGFGLNVAVVRDRRDVGYPVNEGEFFWAGIATTLFWIDPKEELVAIMMTQYLPFNDLYFRDIMHRMLYPAIIE
ncbi:MAG: beta-lactamase family protein, partial [Gammaproteobacteria bacterium]|nr:beta-lactamase family protein [Gammaproteobacteria bacterium]